MAENSRPVILAYHMEAEQLEKVRTCVEALNIGIKVREVLPAQENAPLAMLADRPAVRSSVTPPPPGPITETMIVLCGLSKKELDAVLDAFRHEGIRIPLKAVLTQHNGTWSGRQIQTALRGEREAIRRTRK